MSFLTPCWKDPLANVGPIIPHPTPDSLPDSRLSSAVDGDYWIDVRNETLAVLDDYKPTSPEDDTTKVLRAFASKLPDKGQLAIVSDICCLVQEDGPKLRQLRDHLVDAILKPSKL